MLQELEYAGFERIRRCAFDDSTDEAFTEVEDWGRFECERGAQLAFECFKPFE